MARDYKHENEAYKSKPDQIAKRVARNAARRLMTDRLGVERLKGKEIHHANGNTADNSAKNLRAVKPDTHNFGRAGAQGGKLKKG